jgi:hypothetical protein
VCKSAAAATGAVPSARSFAALLQTLSSISLTYALASFLRALYHLSSSYFSYFLNSPISCFRRWTSRSSLAILVRIAPLSPSPTSIVSNSNWLSWFS